MIADEPRIVSRLSWHHGAGDAPPADRPGGRARRDRDRGRGDRTIPVRFDQVIVTPGGEAIPVTVTLPEHVPVHLDARIESAVELPRHVPVQLGTIRVRASDVGLGTSVE